MTLAIYIPFKNGSIIVADRQNTYFQDLTREPIDKIALLPNFKVALSFAGSTQQCRYLIDQLRQFDSSALFEETYGEVYRKCLGSPELGIRSDDIELLVVICKSAGKELVVQKVLGAMMNKLDNKKCAAIGGGAKYIKPQLQLNTLGISKEQAEEFGFTMLAYASMIDISVGNPLIYGYNAVLIESEIGSILTKHPKSVNIEKLLYNFGS